MRVLPLILFAVTGTLLAAGDAPAYPLWDGQESVEQYSKRVNLPPTKTLNLGVGVKMELVLIPAGRFVMGTPEPAPVDEDGLRRKVITGQALLAMGCGVLLVLLGAVIVRTVRKRQRPRFSLAWLLAMTAAAGVAVLSGLHSRQAARELERAFVENAAAPGRYRSANYNEKPAHAVTLTQPFYMGKFPVTQEQYQELIGKNPAKFIGRDNPVEAVSWYDAQSFCIKMTEQTNQTARLPTEAEWEYACRAGTTTTYFSGDAESDLARVAWCYANSKSMTHPVGRKAPNAFGLYDMHGNVWQWCEDGYDEDYYGKSETENPQGSPQAVDQVMRGGSWGSSSAVCRSANRGWHDPDRSDNLIGFRVVVSPSPIAP